MTKANVGNIDTAIRALLGILFMGLAVVMGDESPYLALGVALVAVVALGTAMAGVCPLYTVLGIDTRPGQPAQRFDAKRDWAHQLR